MKLKDFTIPRGHSKYTIECPELNERMSINRYSDFKAYIKRLCTAHGNDFELVEVQSVKAKGGGSSCLITVKPAKTCSKDTCINLVDALTPEISNVIFNPPATIVFWNDGTKTVVKAREDYDPEKGLAMAISKKMFGNNYGYYNVFAKWLNKWDKHSDTAAKKLATSKIATAKDGTCCKDCIYFIPSSQLNKTQYLNSLDADGACFAAQGTRYVEAFDTCDKCVNKIEEGK